MIQAGAAQASAADSIALLAALLAFVGGLIGAGLATLATLYTARLRRFASERWWERKASAYVDTVDLLAKVRNRIESMTLALEYATQLPPAEVVRRIDEINALTAKTGEQGWDLSKLAAELEDVAPRGTILLSASASEAVTECMATVVRVLRNNEAASNKEHHEAGRRMVAAIDNTIAVVGREAQRDLHIAKGRRRRGSG